jgi:hypothetical protein
MLYDRLLPLAALLSIKNDNVTVIASNCSTPFQRLECTNAMTIAATHAITDTGATFIFIMKGTSVKNLRWADYPIPITLPNRSKAVSTHICDITIPGLPTILMRHIVPGITMAFLIGIRILRKAVCKVTFDDKKCEVVYKDNIILRGYKDPTTDLWTLLLTPDKIAKTNLVEVLISPNSAHMMVSHHVEHTKVPISHEVVLEQPSPSVMLDSHIIKTTPPQPDPCKKRAPCNPTVETAGFSYAQTNKINNVKFAHQSLCNLPIASSSRQSMLDSSRGPHTRMRTQYKSIPLPVLPPQRDI